jgi:hypothetical protein
MTSTRLRLFVVVGALAHLLGAGGCEAGSDPWLDPSLGCANLPQLVGEWTGSFESDEFSDGGGDLRLVIGTVDTAACEAVGDLTVSLNAAGGSSTTSATTFRVAGDRVEYGVVGGVIDASFRGTLADGTMSGAYDHAVADLPGLTSEEDAGTWTLARVAPPPPETSATWCLSGAAATCGQPCASQRECAGEGAEVCVPDPTGASEGTAPRCFPLERVRDALCGDGVCQFDERWRLEPTCAGDCPDEAPSPRPVGAPCDANADCAEGATCVAEDDPTLGPLLGGRIPRGMCLLLDISGPAPTELPPETTCLLDLPVGYACVRSCADDTDCRFSDGFFCRGGRCEFPATAAD